LRNLAKDQRWWYQLDGYQRGKLFFTDVNTGFAVGHYEYAKSGDNTSAADTSVILKTTDAGETWSLNKKIGPDSYYLTCIGFADLNNGFAAGTFGVFFKTSDGGLTWTKQPDLGGANLLSIFFPLAEAGKTGFVTGQEGYIYRTADTGAHWIRYGQGSHNWLASMSFPGEDTGYVSGEAGAILKTTDGGSSWTGIEPPGVGELSAVCFVTA